MQIKIQLGTEIDTSNKNTIKIRIPNTQFWILGEKREDKKWNIYLIDPPSTDRELIRKAMSRKAFVVFSNVILKTHFPYKGKRAQSTKKVINFIKKINRKKRTK